MDADGHENCILMGIENCLLINNFVLLIENAYAQHPLETFLGALKRTQEYSHVGDNWLCIEDDNNWNLCKRVRNCVDLA